MPPSPLVSVGTAGTIVLVEDYDALAAAFGSALKRLAPNFETIVVRSLGEAERITAESSPDLFVIDFDPPPRASIAFLSRMKAAQPNARVLAIAASTWAGLPDERIRPGALHFIEKPFELAKLERALHALLLTKGATDVGALRDLDLTDALALLGTTGASTTLKVTATAGSTGEIHFINGQLTQAIAAGKAGEAALEEMLRWRSARFSETQMREDSSRTFRGRWPVVLSAALGAVRSMEEASAKFSEPASPPSPPRKTIVVIDDTELLLVFVREILHTADPTLQIVTAPTGLEGLQRAAEVMPDLLLLDYSLPDFAGDEVCRRLLENPETARIPVIMMSGHVAEMAATAENFHNVIATIGKPFLSAVLVNLVETTLANLPKISATAPRKRSPRPPRRSPPKEKSKPAEEFPSSSEPPAASAPGPKDPEQPERAPPAPIVRPSPPEPSISLPEKSPIKPAAEIGEHSEKTPEDEAEQSDHLPVVASEPEEKDVAATDEEVSAPDEIVAISSPPESVTAALIPAAKDNTVVLAVPLEISVIQFSAALQIKAIRARPISATVFVHILAAQNSRTEVVAKNFEMERVELDARGQIKTVHLTPSPLPTTPTLGGRSLTIAELAAFPEEGDGTMQLTPDTAADAMPIQLLTLFELVAVELAEGFSVGHLVLNARGAKVRVKMARETTQTGLTFRSAQVLLDRSGKIADVLLDALDETSR